MPPRAVWKIRWALVMRYCSSRTSPSGLKGTDTFADASDTRGPHFLFRLATTLLAWLRIRLNCLVH